MERSCGIFFPSTNEFPLFVAHESLPSRDKYKEQSFDLKILGMWIFFLPCLFTFIKTKRSACLIAREEQRMTCLANGFRPSYIESQHLTCLQPLPTGRRSARNVMASGLVERCHPCLECQVYYTSECVVKPALISGEQLSPSVSVCLIYIYAEAHIVYIGGGFDLYVNITIGGWQGFVVRTLLFSSTPLFFIHILSLILCRRKECQLSRITINYIIWR